MNNQNNTFSMSNVIPGWFRIQHVPSGKTIDFNPRDAGHMELYAYYQNKPEWVIVSPLTGDEDTEPLKAVQS